MSRWHQGAVGVCYILILTICFMPALLLTGCKKATPPLPNKEMSVEGILDEIYKCSDDSYELKFQGGMTITVFNKLHPFYLGHKQKIYYIEGEKGPLVTRVLCESYSDKPIKIQQYGNRKCVVHTEQEKP